jgi:PAS domain S-box-containing protein
VSVSSITELGAQPPAALAAGDASADILPSADIRLLLVTSAAGAELMVSALRRSGVDFSYHVVDNESDVAREFGDFVPRLAIIDNGLPSYSGRQALDYLRLTHPDAPAIIVGDRVGEEAVIELLQAGVRDYVAADRLSRLGPAVLAALHWEDARREQGRAEQEMRLSEVRYRRLFESAKDGILILDAATGKIFDVNPYMVTLLGYTRDEYVGKSLWEIGAFRDAAANRAAFAELQTWQYIRYDDLPLQAKDGRSTEVEFVSNVYVDGEKKVIQCNIRDITERRVMESKLFQAQKLESLGTLTGGLAHDFNNILGVIIGNLDLARPKLSGLAEVDELIGEALTAAVSGAELTRRLLAFARHQPLLPERIEINAVVEGMAKLFKRTLGEDIEVSLALDSQVWPVVADPAQLEASLANLATNARDAMPNGGRLTITTRNSHLDADYAASHPEVTAGDYAVIEISDDGVGIPPELIGRIFEPFFTTKHRANGTGLGLSMVFGFMKQSAGHINVYSEPGRGTTVRLYLPRADTGVVAEARPPPAPPALGGGETVLVVEDNAAMRRVAVRQLNGLGYRVLEAGTAAAALALFATEAIDLLFTDVVMPGGMTGFELARAASALAPALKVLVTSGFPEMKLDGQAGGGMRLLSKPYRKDELARALRETLDA